MEVLEQFVEAKSGRPAKCEDFVVVGDHFLAVIDGATDKTGAKFRGVSGGRFAAEVIGAAIPNLEPAITGRDAITEIRASGCKTRVRRYRTTDRAPSARSIRGNSDRSGESAMSPSE
jgi:hypothetical protein